MKRGSATTSSRNLTVLFCLEVSVGSSLQLQTSGRRSCGCYSLHTLISHPRALILEPPRKALPFLSSLAQWVTALRLSPGSKALEFLIWLRPCQNTHSLGTSLTQGFPCSLHKGIQDSFLSPRLYYA